MLKKGINFTIFFLILLGIILFSPAPIGNKIASNIHIFNPLIKSYNSSYTSIPKINSRAYAVLDRNSGKLLFGKEENSIKKMASTTKIMTAIVILENCNLEDIVTISSKAASTGGSVIGLRKNDKVTIENLLYGLLVYSGNDTAVALAEHLGGTIEGFATIMNEKAKSLGLVKTNFITPHGLDAENHYTTAYELAILTNYALQNETFSKIVSTKRTTITINNYTKEIKNTNALLGNLNGVYGVKTGFTNGAFKCLVTSCKRDNLDIICVLLGADTSEIRLNDTKNLIEYTFANYENVNLQDMINYEFDNFLKKDKKSITISKSQNTNLNLNIENIKTPIVPFKKSEIPNLKTFCCFSNNFEAPLTSNTYIGSIYISLDQTLVATSSITLDNNIFKKTFFQNFMNLIFSIGKFN